MGPERARAARRGRRRAGAQVGRSTLSGEGGYPAAMAEPRRRCARPIDAFFDDVMVMDEDPALRANRLRLLNRFVAAFADVADVGKMAEEVAVGGAKRRGRREGAPRTGAGGADGATGAAVSARPPIGRSIPPTRAAERREGRTYG